MKNLNSVKMFNPTKKTAMIVFDMKCELMNEQMGVIIYFLTAPRMLEQEKSF